MNHALDISPLRSFVAVADAGGFQRAADILHLSQAAVSQHVRRLETAIGGPLVERRGRGWRFTADGEQLLPQARRILALHDEVLGTLRRNETIKTVIVGTTEHAVAQLLPYLAATLESSLPRYQVRFRIDRGSKLRESLAAGRIDIALLLGPADTARATAVGNLELTWYSAPRWTPPAVGDPLSLVAFDAPCALRSRALETLAVHSVPVIIGTEAPQLAGVQAAVSAGLGVALMATLGQAPTGLVARDDLPVPEPLPLAVWSRPGVPAAASSAVSDALRRLLAAPKLAELVPRNFVLAKGA